MIIFEINHVSQGEKEWVAADTNIHALKTYCFITSTDLVDLDDDDIISEVPESKLDELKVVNTDFEESEPEDDDNFREMTFRRWLELHNEPDIVAGTMYE